MLVSLKIVNNFLDTVYVIMRHFIHEFTFSTFFENSNNMKIHTFFNMFNSTHACKLLLLAHALLLKCFVSIEFVNGDSLLE